MPYLLMFCFGILIGSFLNVVIFRLKENKNFVKGRSYCPKCKHKLSWDDNIPLLSFILLRGKCRYCGKSISSQYPLVELATGLLFLIAYIEWYKISNFIPSHTMGLEFQVSNLGLLLTYFIFTSILIIIFIYDLRWYLILDKISIPAIIISFLLNLLLGKEIFSLLLASSAVGGFFLLQFLVSKGKWIGGGDIRMGFLMGMMLGWPNAIVALFISYILGSVSGLLLIAIGKKKMQSQVPFGTFLAIGTYISMLWGHEILIWYVNLIR